MKHSSSCLIYYFSNWVVHNLFLSLAFLKISFPNDRPLFLVTTLENVSENPCLQRLRSSFSVVVHIWTIGKPSLIKLSVFIKELNELVWTESQFPFLCILPYHGDSLNFDVGQVTQNNRPYHGFRRHFDE